jgi:cystathionine beta-lyase/cystathionine gamma-synthase
MNPRASSSVWRRLSQAIFQTSTYQLPSPELGANIAAGYHPERYYTRYGSPNVARVEAMVADLEGVSAAVALGSGMAAISAAILSHVRAGDHVVAQTTHNTAALTLLTVWLPRRGIAVTQVDQTDIEAFSRADRAQNETCLHGHADQPDDGAHRPCRRRSSRPGERGHHRYRQHVRFELQSERPHGLGVDLVVHSATKYLNGPVTSI